MKYYITIATGKRHQVTESDAGKISQAMLSVGPLAIEVLLDGERVFLNAARAVLMIRTMEDDMVVPVP